MNGRGFKKGMRFVPDGYADTFREASKAHLADVLWNLAGRLAVSCDDAAQVFSVICGESDLVADERRDKSMRVLQERREAERQKGVER